LAVNVWGEVLATACGGRGFLRKGRGKRRCKQHGSGQRGGRGSEQTCCNHEESVVRLEDASKETWRHDTQPRIKSASRNGDADVKSIKA
jgi:hypothetical protein